MTTIHCGDALTVLRTMRARSVQCCVTSPPYFGLRDYGTAKWEGGDCNCKHSGVARRCDKRHDKQSTQRGSSSDKIAGNCLKCGAKRIDKQMGLEATPEAYTARMVEVFREVRRVLKDDGTLWLNLGDSYATGAGKVMPLKPKDLIGIPWRVAFALQADGWYLRSDIIWHKPSPLPESVRDRPTKAHEYLFLLAKSKRYYYDGEAIKQAGAGKRSGQTQHKYPHVNRHSIYSGILKIRDKIYESVNRRTVWTVPAQPFRGAHFATCPAKLIEPCILAGSRPGDTVLDPFSGAGTTGLVAQQHGRRFTGIELNPEYIALSHARLGARALAKAA